MQEFFIGVDGGGTKSKVRVEDSNGKLIGQTMGGPASIRLSVEATWRAILTALNEILTEANISLSDKNFVFHAGMGLAGCEISAAYQEFVHTPHPFTTLKVISDAHVACIGAHGAHDGAIIIVGTGVIGYQIEKEEVLRVSGWGFPHDDEGGGAWLGLEAARLTFHWLDHRTEKSPLVEDIFAFFNHDMDQFANWANRANSSEFARLAPIVINHSQQEEIHAVRLMKKAAHIIDKIAHTLEKFRMHPTNTPLPCSLFGGIAPFLEPWIGEELRNRIVPRKADANTGAILMIRELVANKYAVQPIDHGT